MKVIKKQSGTTQRQFGFRRHENQFNLFYGVMQTYRSMTTRYTNKIHNVVVKIICLVINVENSSIQTSANTSTYIQLLQECSWQTPIVVNIMNIFCIEEGFEMELVYE